MAKIGAKTVKQTLTHKDFVRLKTLGIAGLAESAIDPRILSDRYLFVNDINTVKKQRLEEYNIWYIGDSDRLKNFFTRANAITYNMDPLYNENKKSYFWAVSSTEHDIKRSHSGHPRNIVDTLVYIMTIPNLSHEDKTVNDNLQKILKANKFKQQLTQKSRPLTLVEGWGAWKINWDRDISDYPILLYYRADRVDFVFLQDHILRAIIYRDYYQDDEANNYVLYETRRLGPYKDPSTGETTTSLYIEKELFRINRTEYMEPCKLETLPQLKDVQPRIVISNFKHFLGYPNIFYHDSSEEFPGRSIYTGKTDIFDDLDQCFSQSANAVRRSTVHEYFNTLYLETDPDTGMPIQPDAFDRKYIKYAGITDADGSVANTTPVQVVQPAINFMQYAEEEKNLLLNAISGIMSPATMGIDIAKKDNATAEREKEKVTIFTRNNLLDEEEDIMYHIANDLLIAYEFMHLPAGASLTCTEYDISVQYGEFANDSYESRLETVTTGWQAGIMSDEMAIELLYGENLAPEKRDRELAFMQQQREMMSQMPGNAPEMQGDMGMLGAENPYNDAHEAAAIEDLKSDMGIPDLTGY